MREIKASILLIEAIIREKTLTTKIQATSIQTKITNVVCQFCEKRDHIAQQYNSIKKLFYHSLASTANPTTINNSSPNWLLDT